VLDRHRYRGRHRRHLGRSATPLGVAAAAGLAAAGAIALPGTASADVLDVIAQCESGGNARVTGYSGRHFGLFQFDQRTWESVGGVGNPANASPREQRQRAEALLAKRGTQPWNASKRCWSQAGIADRKGVSTTGLRKTADPPRRSKAARAVSTTGSPVPDGYRVQPGDTLGRLAARFDTTVPRIAQANRIANVHRIYVGQTLR
jgi:hypothetical protein